MTEEIMQLKGQVSELTTVLINAEADIKAMQFAHKKLFEQVQILINERDIAYGGH